MSRKRKNEGIVLGIVKAIALYPVVVVAGLMVFIAFNVVVLPALSLLQLVRFIVDARFRNELMGRARKARDEEEVYFHPGHTWARMESPTVAIGMDDFAELLVGRKASGIECADVGTKLKAGDPVWTVRCGDRILEQIVPMSGTILEVNTQLLRDPSQLARIPAREMWVVKMRPAAPIREFRDLFSRDVFRKWNDKVKDRILTRFNHEAGLAYADGGELIPNLASVLTDEEWNELVAAEFK